MGTKFLSLFLGLACVVAWGQGPYPDDPAVLWQQATLYRDAWGTPHIVADNPRAMAFAFGYAQAEDHLAQMLLAYRVANGRAAEIFGETFAASDEFAIRMGHADLAAEALRAADPVTRDLCEGFALGANAWWVEHADQAPVWADGVRPSDILALLHCYLMSFAPFDHPTAWHRAPAATTGNAWAIAPAKSQSGHAILTINPHGSYSGIFSWYEAHLVCGDLDVAGATLFGMPAIMMGHNASLGWALTPNQPDNADVYVEAAPEIERPKTNINRSAMDLDLLYYLSTYADSRTFYVNTPGGMDERLVRKLDGAMGPVIAEDGRTFFSYRAAGYRDFGALRQLVEMGRAQNVVAFKAALAAQQLPCFHVVYADKAGNVLYLYNSKTAVKMDPTPRKPPPTPEQAANPLSGLATGGATFQGGALVYQQQRRIGPYEGVDAEEVEALLRNAGPPAWTLPVPASDTTYSWGAWVPIDALPLVENPGSGYVQACGNPPWLATRDSGLRPWDWPSWFSRDRDTYRARRVRQLLETGTRSFSDSQRMLFDTVSPFALEMVPLILEAAEQNPHFVTTGHPDLPAALKLLEEWNGAATADSVGMTIFHLWWLNLLGQQHPALATEESLYVALSARVPGLQPLILTAVNDAARMLRNEYQTVAVPWGAVHQFRRGDTLVEAHGSMTGEPILVADDRQLEGSIWPATYGFGFGMVVEFAETPRAASLVPFGASENPHSPHFDDQLTLFSQQRLKPTRFAIDDVQRNATHAFGANMALRAAGIVGEFRLQAPVPLTTTVTSDYDPPAPLPEELAPYTVFATVSAVPTDVPARLAMEIYIPETLCAAEHLELLRIYRRLENQWERLPEQTVQPRARIVAGISDRAGTFAVLGPLAFRTTQVAEGTDDEELAPDREFGGILARLQPTPPTSRLVIDTKDDGPILVDPKTWQPVDVTIGAPRGFDMPGMDAPPAAPVTAESGAPPPADEPGAMVETGETSEAPAEKPRVQVTWNPNAPPTIDVPNVQTSDTFRGKLIEIRPPTFDALFRITAQRVIQAQMRLSNVPPAPLPDGLAAFTDYAEIIHTKSTPTPEVAILVSIPPSKCAERNLEQLGIYVYDSATGWTRLPGQTFDAETRGFSALDRPPRHYAVLGPAECLIR